MFRHREMPKRRTVLIAGAAICATQSVGVLLAHQSPVIAAAWGGLLLPIYAASWGVVGILCLVHVWSGRLMLSMSCMTGAFVAWGTAWMLGTIATGSTFTAIRTAVVYFGIGVVIAALTGLTPAQLPREREKALEVLISEGEDHDAA